MTRTAINNKIPTVLTGDFNFHIILGKIYKFLGCSNVKQRNIICKINAFDTEASWKIFKNCILEEIESTVSKYKNEKNGKLWVTKEVLNLKKKRNRNDDLAGYNIDKINTEVYQHAIVVYTQNFVHPLYANVNTQAIEGESMDAYKKEIVINVKQGVHYF
ncbi:hypothetical protein HELRODRAFT_165405 [Helobdella robusta]|uniref:Uncharacterized protein n=1 Tax=Helobdella robusta TaxID=6412 RepID=T1EWQ6_HELRO|nr:hypothetical protein HELRODRAFT_165405 [Helobdella robusta]ESN91376.1 hypothetical protein HELRODRAFT_165405 [Helobdella robusta]